MALRRVFTYLGAIFLMSYIIFCHNVSALSIDGLFYSASLYPQPQWYDTGSAAFNSWYTDGGFRDYNYATNGKGGFSKLEFRRSDGTAFLNAAAGGYYHFLIQVNAYSDSYGFNANDTVTVGLSTESVNCPIIDYDVEMTQVDDQSGGQALTTKYVVAVTCFLTSNSTKPEINLQVSRNSNNSTSRFRVYVPFAMRLPRDASLNEIRTTLNNIYSNNEDILDAIHNLEGAQQKEIDETNAAVEDSQVAGDSSTSDAQTGTASLISTIGSAVSAITSASPTNCLLNGDMGNFDMGQIDLCSNPVPAFVQIIGSLILILVTVPLCIVLFNRFIGLFRSFQG